MNKHLQSKFVWPHLSSDGVVYQVWDTEFVEKALKEKFNSDPTVMADSILNNITVSTLSYCII
jgi:hypothetical protein